MSGGWFGWGAKPAPQPSIEEVATRNEQMLESLQTQQDEKTRMVGMLGENTKRFHASWDACTRKGDMAGAAQFKGLRDRAFDEMKRTENESRLLAGKIATLRGVTGNVQAMHNNVQLHALIKQSNSVTALIAPQMDVDEVQDTMDEVGEYRHQVDEASRALAGETSAPVVDEDERAAEIAAFMGLNTPNAAITIAAGGTHEAEERIRLQRRDAEIEQMLAGIPLPATTIDAAAAPVRRGPSVVTASTRNGPK